MLRPTGAAIGLVEEAEFAEKTIELQKEDLLVLYTDGITEAVNLQNQEFGRERLIKLSQQVNTLPVKEIVQEIRQGLEEFSEGKSLADDTTLVICKIK
jgi:sigma-B regulation protein RsbU (phosphoserine phosphatase)